MRRVAIIAGSIILGCIIMASVGSSCSHSDSSADGQTAGTLPEVSVALLKSPSDMHVKGLSDDIAKNFINSGNLLEPHVLNIRLPNGKSIRLPVRSISVSTYPWIGSPPKVVASIYARRPLKTGHFQEVVADMQQTIQAMGYEPNETMKQMTKWGDIPGNEDRKTGMPYEENAGGINISEKVKLLVRIKPDPEQGWYYLMIFGPASSELYDDALRNVTDASSTTQPTMTK